MSIQFPLIWNEIADVMRIENEHAVLSEPADVVFILQDELRRATVRFDPPFARFGVSRCPDDAADNRDKFSASQFPPQAVSRFICEMSQVGNDAQFALRGVHQRDPVFWVAEREESERDDPFHTSAGSVFRAQSA